MPADSGASSCEHVWELLDVNHRTVGDYNTLYYGRGRRIETIRFFCSKCREIKSDQSVTEGVGLRD